MNSDTCCTLPININANITPKDYSETSEVCSGVHGCSETLRDLLELPFFEEDLSDVYEMKTNLRINRQEVKISWKRRKKHSRKFLFIKRRSETSAIIIAEKTDAAPKNSGEEQQEVLDYRSAEDQSMISEEDKLYDLKTNWTIEQGQRDHCISPEFSSNLQNAGDSKYVQIVTLKDMKLPINEIVALVAEQTNLKTECNIIEHSLGNKDEGKLDLIKDTEQFINRKVDSQGREDVKKVKPASTVIYDLPQEIQIKVLEDKNTETIVKEKILPDLQCSGENRRTRPNYFVAIPITNDQVLDIIEDVQEHIVLKEPKLLRALIPAEKVHLTILVAHLNSETDIRRAVSALMESKRKVEDLLQGEQLVLPLHGIGHFNNQVIYIKITEQAQVILSKIADAVIRSFTDVGVDITGSKDFKPHLTFLKLSKAPSLRRKGLRKICSDLYKEYEDCLFGIELISRIDLCSMHKKNKLSGYYYCESSVLLDTVRPQEVKGSIIENKEDTNEPITGVEPPADCCNASSLANDAETIILDVPNEVTISSEREIKQTEGQPEALHANMEEQNLICFQQNQ